MLLWVPTGEARGGAHRVVGDIDEDHDHVERRQRMVHIGDALGDGGLVRRRERARGGVHAVQRHGGGPASLGWAPRDPGSLRRPRTSARRDAADVGLQAAVQRRTQSVDRAFCGRARRRERNGARRGGRARVRRGRSRTECVPLGR